MWEVISHCDFDLHLSYDYWCWAPFHVSVGHAFFGKVFICPLKKLDCLFFFSLSTPSFLFPSHNLLFSISLTTIEYNTSIYLLLVSHWNGIATNTEFLSALSTVLSPAWHISVSQYVFNEWMNEHILSTYYALNII